MKLYLLLLLMFSFLNQNVFGIINGEDVSFDDSNEGEDEKIYACTENSKTAICYCYGKSLSCFHAFVNDELLESTNIIVNRKNFELTSARLDGNSIKILKKGNILPDYEKNLTSLSLFDNLISTIEDGAFDSFDLLEALNLDHNLLKRIEKKVFTKKLGKTLKELHLNNNKIEDLSPGSFKYLTELVFLDLDKNAKLEIDSGIFGKSLSKLETLKLCSCDIESLDDDTFVYLINLKIVKLNGNPLTSIPVAVKNLPSLVELELSETLISDIDTNAFQPTNNLSILSITNMEKLLVIDDCAFCGIPKLEKLFLENNEHLHEIHENAFGSVNGEGTKNMKKLYISSSNFTMLPERLLNWELLEKLSIGNNPFVCDCSMAWLINNPKLYQYSNEPKCSSPVDFNNASFKAVAGTICGGKGAPNSNGTKVLLVLCFFTVLMLGFVAYKNRRSLKRMVTSVKSRQQGYNNFSPVFV